MNQELAAMIPTKSSSLRPLFALTPTAKFDSYWLTTSRLLVFPVEKQIQEQFAGAKVHRKIAFDLKVQSKHIATDDLFFYLYDGVGRPHRLLAYHTLELHYLSESTELVSFYMNSCHFKLVKIFPIDHRAIYVFWMTWCKICHSLF
jgi:hypothetical protein